MMAPCVVCGKELEPVLPEEVRMAENQPYEATVFSSPGHYGSTAFDPMDGTRLVINVCDRCLIDKKDRVLFLGRDNGLERWNPEC